ncbi:peptidoglycan editing factor PgeF [Exiguobacterium undae]|jgi:YfiH family protein|uniref:Purine nucleoside phosphorylase n=1 Tax=Exiguobacterium undae TaxID=169177 RepID=A0ABX2VBA9_9BACL|nr:peptidoglycan editing factor PgeF [Exiguobacterium undae]OAN15001.1 laccase [Exiguobacterium undae]
MFGQWIKWDTPTGTVRAAFTTKFAAPHGNGNLGLHVKDDANGVVENRQVIVRQLELALENSVWAEQIHGNHVEQVTTLDSGRGASDYETAIKGTDGLVTTDSNVLLMMLFADCVPLIFCDPRTGIIANVHAGWRGTVANIVEETLTKMEQAGAERSSVQMVIGPSIRECCYEVDGPVLEAIDQLGLEESPYVRKENGKAMLSLQKTNALLAERSGVGDVLDTGICTNCQAEDYFSYRHGDHGGRFASLIVKEPLDVNL